MDNYIVEALLKEADDYESFHSDLDEERKIQKYMDDNDLWGDVAVDNGKVYIEFHWGDWKHEHLRCKLLMNELGYEQVAEDVTEDDGSDTYSAIHTYVKEQAV